MIIKEIKENESVCYKEDTIIEGSVGPNSRIEVTNGNLTIKGHVAANVMIILHDKPSSFSSANIKINSVIVSGRSNNVRIGCGATTFSDYKIKIKGHVAENVFIKNDGKVDIAGNVANNTVIRTKRGDIKAFNVGRVTFKSKKGKIKVNSAALNAILISKKGRVTRNANAGSKADTHVRTSNSQEITSFNIPSIIVAGSVTMFSNNEPSSRSYVTIPTTTSRTSTTSSETVAVSSSSTSSNAATTNVLDNYSQPMQDYLKKFDSPVQSHSTLINELKIDENMFKEECYDPITCLVMDRPVSFNGNVFDLDTLLKQPKSNEGYRTCPLTNYQFTLRDLHPARDVNQCIVEVIVHAQQLANKTPNTRMAL